MHENFTFRHAQKSLKTYSCFLNQPGQHALWRKDSCLLRAFFLLLFTGDYFMSSDNTWKNKNWLLFQSSTFSRVYYLQAENSNGHIIMFFKLHEMCFMNWYNSGSTLILMLVTRLWITRPCSACTNLKINYFRLVWLINLKLNKAHLQTVSK